MRLDVRTPVAIVGGLLALTFSTPAGAATVTTTNACLYSVNNEYRDQLVTLGGAGSPREAAAGATVTLSGTFISATLPPSLPKTGYDLGILKAGHNAIPSRVWVAIAAANATPETQVRELDGDRVDDDQGRRGRQLPVGHADRRADPDPQHAVDRDRQRAGELLPGRRGLAAEPAGRPQRRARGGRRQHRRQAQARQPALHHGLPARQHRRAVQELHARPRVAVRDARSRQPAAAGDGRRPRRTGRVRRSSSAPVRASPS